MRFDDAATAMSILIALRTDDGVMILRAVTPSRTSPMMRRPAS